MLICLLFLLLTYLTLLTISHVLLTFNIPLSTMTVNTSITGIVLILLSQTPVLILNPALASLVILEIPTLLNFICVLAILILCIQDLLTGYVNTIICWFFFITGLVVYLSTTNIQIERIIILITFFITLSCCAIIGWLGFGDIPLLILIFLTLPLEKLGLFLFISATIGLIWLWLSHQDAIPFIPCISCSYYLVLLFLV